MINTIVLNLLEAQVTLYATAPGGGTGPTTALWSGQVAERLTVREQWLTAETRPTGAPYPVKHPLVPQYEIAIDRVWALPLDNLAGFKPSDQEYVLEVIWTEEETGTWHRRMFYGVTIASRSFEPRSIESEFVDGQEFAAQYFLADSGTLAVAPSSVVATPLLVYWSGTDGYLVLYNYNDTDDANGFVLADGVTADSRATIAKDGSSIAFDGTDTPVLAPSADGITVAALHDSLPTDLPQLLFYSGTTLLAVVSTTGFWARVIADGALPGTDGFQLQYQGVTVGKMVPGTSAASRAFSFGTKMARFPSLFASAARGKMPCTGRRVPSSANSPTKRYSSALKRMSSAASK